MSNTFLTLFLASLAGIVAYNLIEAVYYEIQHRIDRRNHSVFWEYVLGCLGAVWMKKIVLYLFILVSVIGFVNAFIFFDIRRVGNISQAHA